MALEYVLRSTWQKCTCLFAICFSASQLVALEELAFWVSLAAQPAQSPGGAATTKQGLWEQQAARFETRQAHCVFRSIVRACFHSCRSCLQ
jgi:hypothetical protein